MYKIIIWVFVWLALIWVYNSFTHPAGQTPNEIAAKTQPFVEEDSVSGSRSSECAEQNFPDNGYIYPYAPDLLKIDGIKTGLLKLENHTFWPLWVVPKSTKTTQVVGIAVHPGDSATVELPIGVYWIAFEKGTQWLGPKYGFAKIHTCPNARDTIVVHLSKPIEIGPGEHVNLSASPDGKSLKFNLSVEEAPPMVTQIVHGKTLQLPGQKDGHYYVSGSINGMPVTFLIDTGASIVSVPKWMAFSSGIAQSQACKPGFIRTANGKAKACFYTASEFEFGIYKLKNVKLSASDGLTTPLLGMNVLNLFHIEQADGYMKLTPNRVIR